jgi:hypothetical protein
VAEPLFSARVKLWLPLVSWRLKEVALRLGRPRVCRVETCQVGSCQLKPAAKRGSRTAVPRLVRGKEMGEASFGKTARGYSPDVLCTQPVLDIAESMVQNGLAPGRHLLSVLA